MENGKEMVKPCVPKMEKNNNDKEVTCVTIPAGAIPTPTFGGFQVGSLYIGNDGFTFGVTYNSPKTMPKEANTYLYVDNGQVRLANYKDGQRTSDIGIMESIADIQVLNKKVVMVTFSDGKLKRLFLIHMILSTLSRVLQSAL